MLTNFTGNVNIRERVPVNYMVMEDIKTMTGTERNVQDVIAYRSKWGQGECFASLQTLCADTGMTKNTLTPTIRLLIAAKRIIKMKGRSQYGTNVYKLNPNIAQWVVIDDTLRASVKKPRKLKSVPNHSDSVNRTEGNLTESEDTESDLSSAIIDHPELNVDSQFLTLNYPKDNLIREEGINSENGDQNGSEKEEENLENKEGLAPPSRMQDGLEYEPSTDTYRLTIKSKAVVTMTSMAMQLGISSIKMLLATAVKFYSKWHNRIDELESLASETPAPPVKPASVLEIVKPATPPIDLTVEIKRSKLMQFWRNKGINSTCVKEVAQCREEIEILLAATPEQIKAAIDPTQMLAVEPLEQPTDDEEIQNDTLGSLEFPEGLEGNIEAWMSKQIKD